MSNNSIIATLKALAKDFPRRSDFNKAVAANFGKRLGSGAFRTVYDAGDVVVKLRRHRVRDDGSFGMDEINTANAEEAESYTDLKRAAPLLANFVLQPTYVKLPNKHDAIIMQKVEKLWGRLTSAQRKRHEDEDTLMGKQYRIISHVFYDSHWNNIGIIGNRAYLIDFNRGFCGDLADEFEDMAKNVLTELGVLKPKLKAVAAA